MYVSIFFITNRTSIKGGFIDTMELYNSLLNKDLQDTNVRLSICFPSLSIFNKGTQPIINSNSNKGIS